MATDSNPSEPVQLSEAKQSSAVVSKQCELRVQGLGSTDPARVRKVFVSVGQTVARDAKLLIVETDKVRLEVCSPAAGLVTEVMVAAKASVREGDLLVVLELSESEPPPRLEQKPLAGDAKAGAGVQPTTPAAPPIASVKRREPAVATLSTISHSGPGASVEYHASPWIRSLSRARSLDLGKVVGTGRFGRILEEDLERAVHLSLAPSSQNDPPASGGAETRPLPWLQCAVGRNLLRNWTQIPHVTQFDETDITELEAFRVTLNHERQEQGSKLSLLPFVVKATACALSAFPEFNSSLVGEDLILKRSMHIGIAIDTADGLQVPVIKDAEWLTLPQIAHEISRFAERARASELTAADVQGGSFTISNLGGAGGTAFTPIINAPEVAILGVSKAELKPKWNGSAFVPRLMLPLSLSYDHRVINGVAGARFVSHLGSVLSDLRRALL